MAPNFLIFMSTIVILRHSPSTLLIHTNYLWAISNSIITLDFGLVINISLIINSIFLIVSPRISRKALRK